MLGSGLTLASISCNLRSAVGKRRSRWELQRRAQAYSRDRKDSPNSRNTTPGTTGRTRPAAPRTRNIQPAATSATRFNIGLLDAKGTTNVPVCLTIISVEQQSPLSPDSGWRDVTVITNLMALFPEYRAQSGKERLDCLAITHGG